MSDSLRPHESQHARPPCPSPALGVYLNSCPSSRWCHPAISSSIVPFSSCPQSLPASESFPMSQLFTWGGQNIGVSASAAVLPKNSQDWSTQNGLVGSPWSWLGWPKAVNIKNRAQILSINNYNFFCWLIVLLYVSNIKIFNDHFLTVILFRGS